MNMRRELTERNSRERNRIGNLPAETHRPHRAQDAPSSQSPRILPRICSASASANRKPGAPPLSRCVRQGGDFDFDFDFDLPPNPEPRSPNPETRHSKLETLLLPLHMLPQKLPNLRPSLLILLRREPSMIPARHRIQLVRHLRRIQIG